MTDNNEGQTMPSPSSKLDSQPPEVFFLREMQKRLKVLDRAETDLDPQDQRLLMAIAVHLRPDWDSNQYDAAAQLFYDYTSALAYLGENTKEIGYLPAIAARLFLEPTLTLSRGMLLEHLGYLAALKADAHP